MLPTKYMGNAKDGVVISNWRTHGRFHKKDYIWTEFYVVPKVEERKNDITEGIIRYIAPSNDRQNINSKW